MINLRKMRVEEYPAYCDYFIADYSQEIAQNYGHSIEIATDLAHQDLIRHFPNGLETNEHDLMCIEIDSANSLKVIGYLWHSIKSSDASTFIYDFYIADEYRGNGYGKQAISQLEKLLVSADINQIKLRVAYQNQRALALYQEIGFTISGYNMSKKLVG
ncbi:GNAT family N-acetyltransferase [Marinomonas sp. FW-1]|uniref:GNAT family N-acetyltransferase n=1 Tax=Marinomonas sp. FW-1 TaxID=2071621 RepID=UPI0010C10BA2|nr:GNAT family N-acetyltransferase [Marinomonas sp. FW-1]